MLSFLSRRKAPAQKACSPLIALRGAMGGGRAHWTPEGYSGIGRAAYARNPVAHRCLRLVAETVAAIPLAVEDGGRKAAAHPMLDLLTRPNPGQSGRDLREAAMHHMMLDGNAYIEAIRDEAGAPRALYALRPDRVKPVLDDAGWPVAYEYRVGGRVRRINAEHAEASLMHLRAFNPHDDHYGLSPLSAAAASVDLHGAASLCVKALLDNGAMPSGAVVYNGPGLSQQQFDRLREEVESQYQGAANAGRPMLLEGGLDFKPMSFNPVDMELLKTRDAAARDIALALGVPPMLLGLPGDATYSNYLEANRAFNRQTVLPLAQRLADGLSVWLGADFGGARVTLDLEHAPAFAEERDGYWSRIAGADFLSDGEKRRLLGFDKEAGANG